MSGGLSEWLNLGKKTGTFTYFQCNWLIIYYILWHSTKNLLYTYTFHWNLLNTYTLHWKLAICLYTPLKICFILYIHVHTWINHPQPCTQLVKYSVELDTWCFTRDILQAASKMYHRKILHIALIHLKDLTQHLFDLEEVIHNI